MDVTPQLLREVEFREQWRGYNPDEVDDFLERLAVALEQLQERLRDATQKANSAERVASEPSETEEQLRRTLVLAQRTADAALEEAREEANRMMTEARAEAEALRTNAREQSERMLTEARDESERMLAEAHEAALRADEEARRDARDELERLREARDALQGDVDALSEFLEAQRARLLAVTQDQLRWLQSPGRFDLPDAPDISDVDLEVAPAPTPVAPTFAPSAPAATEEHVDDEPDLPADGPDADDAWVGEPTGAASALPPGRAPASANGPVAATTGDDEDDPFMAELRRAVHDREPLGPRGHDGLDGEGPGPDDDPDAYDPELSPSARFRLRRKR